MITQYTPAEAGLNDCGEYWRFDSVKALILKEFSICYSRRFTYEHLKKWGSITPDAEWIPRTMQARSQRRPTILETGNAGPHQDPFLSPKRGRPSKQDNETGTLPIDYEAGTREAQKIMQCSEKPGLPGSRRTLRTPR